MSQMIGTMDEDLAIHQKMDDEPNDVGGLSAEELKAKYDYAALALQEYLNKILVPGVNNQGLDIDSLRAALRDHIEIDPSSVRDNNVSVSEEVIERLWLEGANPTVKDALLQLQGLIDQESENLMGYIEARAQVVCGTVTGNSKAGADSPNRITFPFKPKMVYVTKSGRTLNSEYSSMRYDSFLWVEGVTGDQVAAGVNRRYKLEGNTLSWWVDNTSYAGAVCGSYVAIG